MASAEAAGRYVNETLQTAVPWHDLVAQSNLQLVLHAIVQRLDRHDQSLAAALANTAGGTAAGEAAPAPTGSPGPGPPVTVIPTADLDALRHRLGVLENTALQGRVEALAGEGGASLRQLATEGDSQFKLADHVIPLTQMKVRVQGCEVGLQATGEQLDAINKRLADTARALHEELTARLAQLEGKVDTMFQDLSERVERMVKGVEAKVAAMATTVTNNTRRLDDAQTRLEAAEAEVSGMVRRTEGLEAAMDGKADRAELETAITEIRDELAAMNIEEIVGMAERANQRIDLMDERCDSMDDAHKELQATVHRFKNEMEDLALEKQIENLRRELEEAKTGVFVKATQRMDAMQGEAKSLKEELTSTMGQVQVNRECIQDVEDVVRSAGVDIGGVSERSSQGSTKAVVAQLKSDVDALQAKYAAAFEKENSGNGKIEATESMLADLNRKIDELSRAKADQSAVERALQNKADREDLSRETEANQRAVDEALSTMNAGTQGIQQMLEQQEGAVSQMGEKLVKKPDREELEVLQSQLKQTIDRNEMSAEQAELTYGKYGATLEEAAAGMRRPMDCYSCISCNRPLKPPSSPAYPTLPLLPASRDTRQVPFVARRKAAVAGTAEVPRLKSNKATRQRSQRSVELVGDDGRIYRGRVPTGNGMPRLPGTDR